MLVWESGKAAGSGSLVENQKDKVKQYFESAEQPWEDAYSRDPVEAQTYRDRNNASLTLVRQFVPAEGLVLEIGSGPGFLSQALASHGFDVVSSDLALRMARQTRDLMGKDRVIIADVRSLPFKPNAFDAIVLIGVIAYVNDPVKVLRGLSVALKPNGILLLSSPNSRLMLSAVSRKINDGLSRIGFRRRERSKTKTVVAETRRFYRAEEFNELVVSAGYSFLAATNIGFGRLKILGRNVLPARLDIAIGRLLSAASRLPMLHWLSRYAFSNVACFRTASNDPHA